MSGNSFLHSGPFPRNAQPRPNGNADGAAVHRRCDPRTEAAGGPGPRKPGEQVMTFRSSPGAEVHRFVGVLNLLEM